MICYDKIKVQSKSRKIAIRKLFGGEKIPSRVLVGIDYERQAIKLTDATEAPEEQQVYAYPVDPKCRVTVPRWIVDRLGEVFFVTDESFEEHLLFSTKAIHIDDIDDANTDAL